MHQIPKLRLNSFRNLYRAIKTKNPAINLLIYGVIYWLENHVIEYKVKTAVDTALIRYQAKLPPPPVTPWEGPEIIETYENPDVPLPTLSASYKWVEKETKDPDKPL